VIKNEALFRQVNERIEELSRDLFADKLSEFILPACERLDLGMALQATIAYCPRVGGDYAEERRLRELTRCAAVCKTAAAHILSGPALGLEAAQWASELCAQVAAIYDRINADDVELASCRNACRRCSDAYLRPPRERTDARAARALTLAKTLRVDQLRQARRRRRSTDPKTPENFSRYGVRVPAIIVSALVGRRSFFVMPTDRRVRRSGSLCTRSWTSSLGSAEADHEPEGVTRSRPLLSSSRPGQPTLTGLVAAAP
jgi:hypothetical protein